MLIVYIYGMISIIYMMWWNIEIHAFLLDGISPTRIDEAYLLFCFVGVHDQIYLMRTYYSSATRSIVVIFGLRSRTMSRFGQTKLIELCNESSVFGPIKQNYCRAVVMLNSKCYGMTFWKKIQFWNKEYNRQINWRSTNKWLDVWTTMRYFHYSRVS